MHPSKREILLDTAERLFYTAGFHATGIDRVVREAGVARMTLYNHFPSKEALVEAVIERRFRRYLDDLRDTVEQAQAGKATDALAGRHCAWLETVSDHGCIVIKAIGEFEQNHPPIADLGRRLKRELIQVIGAALARDGHPADPVLAERVLVVLEGVDTLVPVLGPTAATRHARSLVPAALAAASGMPA